MSPGVNTAMKRMGQDALDALHNQFGDISNVLMEDFGDPTIKPILDLTDIENGARALDAIFANRHIAGSTSGHAQRIINDELARRLASGDISDEPTPASIEFNQYNNSPKALSSAEIYRQTKNQLSIVKGGLPK